MSIAEFKSFETERLFIRPTVIEDAEFILRLLNSPKWKQFIGDRNVNNIKEAETYIKVRILPQLEKLGFSNYTVIRKEDHAKIGSCGLYDRDGITGIDLGFAFLSEYEKKGYAFEAASAIYNAAGSEFKIEKLKAFTLENNTGSRKLIEKLGFKFQETIKIPNNPKEFYLYESDLTESYS